MDKKTRNRKTGMYVVKGSYADKIIVAISYSGNFPYTSIDMIGGNHRMLLRAARKLKAEKYISITGKGQAKTMQLLKKGRELLQQRYPSMYNFFLQQSDNATFKVGKSNASDIWRRHRFAEIMVMIRRLGTYFLSTQKPEIFSKNQEDKIELSDGLSLFYSSKELKNIDEDIKLRVVFTRILGMLSSKSAHYALYNTNKGLMMWNNQGEHKAQKMLDTIINSTFYQDSYYYCNSAILFMDNLDVARKVLNSKKGPKSGLGFEFLSFDNTFSNMHAITMDEYGVLQLKILITDNYKDKLFKYLFTKKEIITQNLSVDADAFDKESGTVKIEFLTGNIGKLKRAVMASNFHKSYKFEVLCFPFQEDFLKSYLPENFQITTVDLGMFYQHMFTN